VAAEILRPASRVFRTWDRRVTSSWLCEAMEWVKTTRKGAKEEKRRILLSIRTYLTRISKFEGMA